VARAEFSSAVPWAAGPRDSIVQIVADAISGRRILPPGAPPVADLRP